MIGKTISHYKILEKIGEGGMGIVYLAEDTKLDRNVALKFLPKEYTKDQDAKERFQREAKAAAALNHPNIVTIHEINEHEDQTYIAMEYVEGETLKEITRRGGPVWPPTDKNETNGNKGRHMGLPLHLDQIINITTQICEGLQKAHDAGIIHRDIKPENILIDSDGRVKILDFGLAKLNGVSQLTRESSTFGTIHYMSPEQSMGKDVDHRTDIWSLGVILYEMITGQLPFKGDYEQAVIYSILNEKPEPVSGLRAGIPVELERLINKALVKKTVERYHQAQELLTDLKSMKNDNDPEDISEKKDKSIIVLPFINMSPDPDQEYFSDGLTEEIITDLSQIQSLRLISRTSSMILKGTKKSIRQIGEELKVNYVLEGSVRKAGNNVRISIQFIDATTDIHLWGNKFSGTLDDVFALQDKVSQEVTNALRISLAKKEQKSFERRYTENFKAYDLYLKGLHLRRKFGENNISNSILCFEKAIECDPDFAPAYAGLAYAKVAEAFYMPVKASEAYMSGKKAAQKALKIDKQLPEAYEAISLVAAYFEWDWDASEAAARKIIEINSNYSWGYFHLSQSLMIHGKFKEAIEIMEKGHNLDPLNTVFNRNLGILYLQAGKIDLAIETLNRAIEIDSEFPSSHLYLGLCYLFKKNYEEALSAMKKEKNSLKEMIDPQIGVVYTLMGKREKAQEILEKYSKIKDSDYTSYYSLSKLCFALGKIDQGLDLLEKGYDNHDILMHQIKTDFLLDSVRSEPRFKTLLKKMGLDK